MPLYSYRCSACGERVDILRSMVKREDPLVCPGCGGECKPVLTVCHWNWGTAAASHGGFIEETRKGHSGVMNVGGKK